MRRFDTHTEYIVMQADYQTALNSLPATGAATGTDSTGSEQLVESIPVMVREYRLNTSPTINAGKWTMWAVKPMPIVFAWENGTWQPPANLVIRQY